MPQLTIGQLQSINQIELTDGSNTNKLYLCRDFYSLNNVEGPGERPGNVVGIESIKNVLTSTHTTAKIDVSGSVEDFADLVDLTPIPSHLEQILQRLII